MPRGAYHYYYFCRPASEQAAWFINNVPREPGALPAVLDLEWTHKSKTCPWSQRPDPATVRREALLFLQALTVYYGKRPIIYTTVDFYHDNDLGRVQGFNFWLRSVAGHPEEIYPDQRWAFWQYTGTGMVGGVDGPTDINVFAGTRSQWMSFAYGGWTGSVREPDRELGQGPPIAGADPLDAEGGAVQPLHPLLDLLDLRVGVVAVGAGEGADRARLGIPSPRRLRRSSVRDRAPAGRRRHRRFPQVAPAQVADILQPPAHNRIVHMQPGTGIMVRPGLCVGLEEVGGRVNRMCSAMANPTGSAGRAGGAVRRCSRSGACDVFRAVVARITTTTIT